MAVDLSALSGASVPVYRCRACGRPLFLQEHLRPHDAVKRVNFRKGGAREEGCQSYFVQKLSWMGELVGDEGLVLCPGCGAKLGAYKWSGSACTCGFLVVPYLALYRNKVDRVLTPRALLGPAAGPGEAETEGGGGNAPVSCAPAGGEAGGAGEGGALAAGDAPGGGPGPAGQAC